MIVLHPFCSPVFSLTLCFIQQDHVVNTCVYCLFWRFSYHIIWGLSLQRLWLTMTVSVSKLCISSMTILVKQVKYFLTITAKRSLFYHCSKILRSFQSFTWVFWGYLNSTDKSCGPEFRRFLSSFICCYVFFKWNIYFFILVFPDLRIVSVSFFSCILISLSSTFYPPEVLAP